MTSHLLACTRGSFDCYTPAGEPFKINPRLDRARWAASVYGAAEQGDHFLMFKNPIKLTSDLRAFLGHREL
jgi:hypothetical protein